MNYYYYCFTVYSSCCTHSDRSEQINLLTDFSSFFFFKTKTCPPSSNFVHFCHKHSDAPLFYNDTSFALHLCPRYYNNKLKLRYFVFFFTNICFTKMHSTEFSATHLIANIRLLTICKQNIQEKIINSYYILLYYIFHNYISKQSLIFTSERCQF